MILLNFHERKFQISWAEVAKSINGIEFDSGDPFVFHVNELFGWIN